MKYFVPPDLPADFAAPNADRCRKALLFHDTLNQIHRRHRKWRNQFLAILEWSRVDKGMFILAMMSFYYVQHFVWCAYVLNRPDHDRLVNAAVLNHFFWTQLVLLASAGVMLIYGWWLRQKDPEAVHYQHIVLPFFSLTMIVLFYFAGALSFSAGLFLLAAPVWGLILLDRLPVWWATGITLTALVGLGYGSAYGWLPNAPLMVPPTDQASQLFWTNTTFFFNAPFFVMILLLADQMLAWWHSREDKIRELSRTDMLTGVHNRLSIMDFLDHEVARSRRMQTSLSVVILDLDHFKHVNDNWGHPVGDLVLQKTAQIMRQNIREIDAVGRYGGEEFIIVLPGTDEYEAHTIIERCRSQLAQTEIMLELEQSIRVTASFGFVCSQGPASDPHHLISTADQALYAAKHNGRNRIESRVLSPVFEEVTV